MAFQTNHKTTQLSLATLLLCLLFSNARIEKDYPLSKSRRLQNSDIYQATAFECDENRNAIHDEKPKRAGDTIRVCVQPTPVTLDRGVLMRRIDYFTFQGNDGAEQEAIAPNGRESSETLNNCEPGSTICVFSTRLVSDLFLSDGVITGVGVAAMEYEQTRDDDSRRRQLIDEDIQFAGYWEVEMVIPVERSTGGSSLRTPYELWTSLSFLAKGVIGLLATSLLICILCCMGYAALWMYKMDKDEEKFIGGKFPRQVNLHSRNGLYGDGEWGESSSAQSEESPYVEENLEEYDEEDGIGFSRGRDQYKGRGRYMPNLEEGDEENASVPTLGEEHVIPAKSPPKKQAPVVKSKITSNGSEDILNNPRRTARRKRNTREARKAKSQGGSRGEDSEYYTSSGSSCGDSFADDASTESNGSSVGVVKQESPTPSNTKSTASSSISNPAVNGNSVGRKVKKTSGERTLR